MTVDQVISGASNVLIAVLAARLLGAVEFGFFGIVFLVYTMLIGVTRALVSDPVLVQPFESREQPGEAIGTSCLLSVALAIALAAVAVSIRFWQQALGDALIVLAVCLPLLVLQDVGRYLAFATRRAARAVVLDSVWLVLMLAGVGVLLTRHGRTLASFVAVWGGSGAAAGTLLFAWYGVRELRLGLSWLRRTWGLAWRFLVSYTSSQGAALAMSSEIGGVAGAGALAGIQGTLLLVRPFTTFAVAAVAAGTGEVAADARDPRRIRRHAIRSSGLTALAAALNMLVMVALPTQLGKIVLGDAWHFTQPLLVPAGLQIVFTGLLLGPQAALFGLKAMREAMRLNVASTALMLVGGLGGAVLDGARGALWLAAASQAISMAAWWLVFATRLRTCRGPVVPAAGEQPVAGGEQPVGLAALLADAAR